MIEINKFPYSDKTRSIKNIDPKAADDIFISCISFEPRTFAILNKLDDSYFAEFGFFIFNEKFLIYEKMKVNKQKFENSKYLSKFKNFQQTFSSLENPIKIIISLDKIIQTQFNENDNISITIDTTTIPRGELLTLLYYLRNHTKVGSIRILYSSPEDYDANWLSEGYINSTIPPFFEGSSCFEKNIALFILTGFEYDRPLGLIEDLEPSLLILGKPEPGTSEKFLEQSKKLIAKLNKSRKIETKIVKISANNPFKSRDEILSIISEHSESYNFYITVLGPKLELIGAYLAYEQKPNFRMIYPIPLIYNVENYSKGCKEIFEVILLKKNKSD